MKFGESIMFRQSSSRNHRSKGFRVKHVLQISLLLVVIFWLIFQVKHSYHDSVEKRKKQPTSIDGIEVSDLGRKGLLPRTIGILIEKKRPEAKTEIEVEDGDHHVDEEPENGEKEDEGRGADDYEIDESGPEKTETETYRGEDNAEVEKDDEFKSQSFAEIEGRDGGGRNAHEAREVNYVGDDASSAVTHDTRNINNEDPNENSASSVVEGDDRSSNSNETRTRIDQSAPEVKKVGDGAVEVNLHQNATARTGFRNLPATVDNSTGMQKEAPAPFLQVMVSNMNISNMTGVLEGPAMGKGPRSKRAVQEQSDIFNLNLTSAVPRMAFENTASKDETSQTSMDDANGKDETAETSMDDKDDKEDAVQVEEEDSDSSITLEEKDPLMDLDPLEGIQNEGGDVDVEGE